MDVWDFVVPSVRMRLCSVLTKSDVGRYTVRKVREDGCEWGFRRRISAGIRQLPSKGLVFCFSFNVRPHLKHKFLIICGFEFLNFPPSLWNYQISFFISMTPPFNSPLLGTKEKLNSKTFGWESSYFGISVSARGHHSSNISGAY